MAAKKKTSKKKVAKKGARKRPSLGTGLAERAAVAKEKDTARKESILERIAREGGMNVGKKAKKKKKKNGY